MQLFNRDELSVHSPANEMVGVVLMVVAATMTGYKNDNVYDTDVYVFVGTIHFDTVFVSICFALLLSLERRESKKNPK